MGRTSDRKARHNTNAGSIPRCGDGFFAHCQLPAQTVLQCSNDLPM